MPAVKNCKVNSHENKKRKTLNSYCVHTFDCWCIYSCNYFNFCLSLLTVLQHLHDVLLDHGQDDFATQAAGDPVQCALSSHGVAVEGKGVVGGVRGSRRVAETQTRQTNTCQNFPNVSGSPGVKPTCQSRRPPARRPWPTRRRPPGPPSWPASGALRVRDQGAKFSFKGFSFRPHHPHHHHQRREGSLDAHRPEPRWPCASAAWLPPSRTA